ncbi:NrdC thioredoxin [Acinetobacter phage Acj61]|uniref:NrdC thioredoxin n=1 Tax=Acinetobacter phage Acj61 TaxID=760732 RepID=E5E498_9CAUD|nr:NrdC thioredoxin [Acinetobacter phage Acj61]ADG36082.1 NrdC thioredoxin [Acinetobacter phage Acj61]
MITIYGFLPEIQKCINCDGAKRLCTAKKREFEFVSLADSKNEEGPVFNDEIIADLLQKLRRTSIVGLSLPVVFEDEKHIGGFNELRTHIAKSK